MKQPNTKLLHIFQMVGTAKTEVQRPKQVELNIAAQSSKENKDIASYCASSTECSDYI